METSKSTENSESVEFCPHCGHRLSPWQQVLLRVDRALTCKNCWYRIILDVPVKDESEHDSSNEKKQPKG